MKNVNSVALRMISILLAVAFMGAIGCTSPAMAEQTIPFVVSDEESTDTRVDEYHDRAGQLLLNSADWVDSFFRTETYTEEDNQTRLRIRLSGFQEEGEDFDFNIRFNLKLQLPGTEERLRLVIGSDPDVNDTLDDSPHESVRDRSEEDNDNSQVGLEYTALKGEKHRLNFTPGVRIRDGTVVGSLEGRYRYVRPIDVWTMRFKERLRWFTDDGFDSRTEIDFERPLSERFFFRTTPELRWFEDKDGVYYSLKTSLFHSIFDWLALEYQFNNYLYSETDGQFEEINFRIRYRQQIWRQWLTMEVAPQLAWYEERDFETVPGILVRLEIWLGQWEREVH